MMNGKHRLLKNITHTTMKKAVILLYVIAAVQAVGTLSGFAVAYKVFNLSMYEAGKSFGAEMIKICDQRYQQK